MMLIAYANDGSVIATLSHMVSMNEDGEVVGLVNFDEHERSGGEMTDVWNVDRAKGSKVWPEWIGGQAHNFRVELEGQPGRKRLAALIHKESGHRRERVSVESAIAQRIASSRGAPADIRDLVGGPDRPLRLDAQGRTEPRPVRVVPQLPVIATARASRPKE
jgi:hypothetical protein